MAETENPIYEKYYLGTLSRLSPDSQAAENFKSAVKRGKQEILDTIELYQQYLNDENYSRRDFSALSEAEKFEAVYNLGNYGVQECCILCVDFIKYIPNCDALAVFFKSRSLPEDKRSQLLDIGEGPEDRPDSREFERILESLRACDPGWKYQII